MDLRLRASLPPLPLIMHGTDSVNRKPPAESTVKRAAEAFAPKYDEWMRGHHALARSIIDDYEERGQMGKVVAEVGCGTAILTTELMLKRMEAVFKDLAVSGVTQPTTYICLDFSQVMLSLAKLNVVHNLHEAEGDANTVEPPAGRKRLKRNDFEIRDSKSRIDFLYRGQDGKEQTVLKALFACADATKLSEVEDGGRIDTVILSYVMHWFRGYDGKLDVLAALSHELAPGGRIISIEEYPLVVRADLHPENRDVLELAGLIQQATTVIPPAHMEALYKAAGFTLQCTSKTARKIDEYHTMYGSVYSKATAD